MDTCTQESNVSASLPGPTVSTVTLLPPMHVVPVLSRESSDMSRDKYARVAARFNPVDLRTANTFGMLGDDNALYPSSQWVTENKVEYVSQTPEVPMVKPSVVIYPLDTRKHNPQSRKMSHIKRIQEKPVCNVQWMGSSKSSSDQFSDIGTVYGSSYTERQVQPRHIIHRYDKETLAEGSIVPLNSKAKIHDSRTEMMLPVCDSTAIPTPTNPHKYLLRKRKCAQQSKPNHVIGHNERPTSNQTSRPASNQTQQPSEPEVEPEGRVSVSSLSGYAFTRRKFIPPPRNNITRGFDGGVPVLKPGKFCDNFMPAIRTRPKPILMW